MLITGPHAKTTKSLCSNYIGQRPQVVSIENGVRRALPLADITIEQGCGMTSFNRSEANSALEEARLAQYTLVALGLDQSQEREVCRSYWFRPLCKLFSRIVIVNISLSPEISCVS